MSGLRPGTTAVAGLGLIGGSVALALERAGFGPVYGIDPDEQTRLKAEQAGIKVHAGPGPFLAGCQLLVLACPPAEADSVLREVAGQLPPRAVVTDVYSVKASTSGLVPPADIYYVPSHPMAGTERSGFAAASPDLFAGRPWAITAHPDTPPLAVAAVADLVAAVGARPVFVAPDVHDRIVAYTSHLPYLVALALAATVAEAAENTPGLTQLIGPGFLDTTRLAASPPSLGCEFFRYNQSLLLEAADDFLQEFARWIARFGPGDTGQNAFETAIPPAAEAVRAFRLSLPGTTAREGGRWKAGQ